MKNKFKTGYVSIIGRPNVGKSTLLNYMINQKLSIVSRKPQTTRWNLYGIKTGNDAQIIFIDTPGLQKQPKSALNRHMNRGVTHSLDHIDIILFVIEALKWNELDQNVVELLKGTQRNKLFLIINKVDKINDKSQLLSFIDMVSGYIEFKEIIPMSAIKGIGLANLELLLIKNLPIAPPLYPEDQVTDKNERFFAAEFIREQLILRLSDELPYVSTITIDEFKDEDHIIHIHASIWVETRGQKSIIIGKNGNVLKVVGRAARLQLEKLFDKKVNLKSWVKIKSNWANSEQALKQLGYYE
ncbi:MAG: GTPase Era [Legionellales bacterium]|nr:GTPase Era [Legionellales bacterium]|tara:strand:+ start:130 stop:1026 length:897 start_codon:yes stop_codon:yes gene_type:complete